VSSRRALVIEDDADHQLLLRETLEIGGYEVAAIDSAVGAMDAVRALRPHVILLDLGLPLRSGTSLLAELKADPTTADVPVVVVSGIAELLPEDRRAQAAAVLAKPFSPRALLEAVRAARWPRVVDGPDGQP